MMVSPDGGGTWQPWIGSYELGDIPSGQSRSLLLAGQVDACAQGVLVNRAAVTALSLELRPEDNEASAATVVWSPGAGPDAPGTANCPAEKRDAGRISFPASSKIKTESWSLTSCLRKEKIRADPPGPALMLTYWPKCPPVPPWSSGTLCRKTGRTAPPGLLGDQSGQLLPPHADEARVTRSREQ